MILGGSLRQQWLLPVALLLACAVTLCHAAGPRWVAGPQWTNQGKPMGWYRPDVHYFVDQGPLSQSVDNPTATALVNAAASVWNVQGVSLSLTNGGSLAEDVNGGNVYLGSSGLIWPADVQSTNYTSVQIAVVFDADGSITDTLLGSGASAPSNCRESGVTESVDLFVPPGQIAHAIVLVNGRCSGPAQEQQLQLQYQMERVFGRVIGLGWSQTNDNVFTGNPAPIYPQQMHWPIMHPIDILCGPYTYQCLPQPFTLRDDDVAALEMVYSSNLNASPSSSQISISGQLMFPTGQGMNGANVVVQRHYDWTGYQTDPYQDVSSVSGFLTRTNAGNPVTGPSPNTLGTDGGTGGTGYFLLYGIPALTQYDYTSLPTHAEAINPLYTGAYAVGPYGQGTPVPSGTLFQNQISYAHPGDFSGYGWVTIADAATQCNSSADGTEGYPAPVPADGMWSGRLCGVGHTPWNSFPVKAGRTATIEVTALDETGTPTMSKAQPVLGLWNSGDATGTQPTLARAAASFNAAVTGMTQLRASFTGNGSVRLAIADARGDGRPDYTYRARLLYADTVLPARLPSGGGTIQITGTGFTVSSRVTVGGVLATITSQSATSITATAPTLAAVGNAGVTDVAVTDAATGASASITGGLTYNGAANDVLTLVQSPASTVAVGASSPLMLQLVDGSGNPAANSTITVSVTSGAAQFSTCGLSTCTLLTDNTGRAQTQVEPVSAGTVQLQAVAASGSSVTASFNATASSQGITFLRPVEYVAAGAGTVFAPAVIVTGNGAGLAAQAIVWSASSPRIQFGAQQVSGTSASIPANGAMNDGEVATVQACASGSVCATQTINAVAASQLEVVTVAGDAQSVAAAGSLGAVIFRVTDAVGDPVAGAAVTVHQDVTGWQPPCANGGRCAPAPVYGTATATIMSNDDGMVTVTPLQYASTAATTRVTAAAGTSGVVTATLQKTP